MLLNLYTYYVRKCQILFCGQSNRQKKPDGVVAAWRDYVRNPVPQDPQCTSIAICPQKRGKGISVKLEFSALLTITTRILLTCVSRLQSICNPIHSTTCTCSGHSRSSGSSTAILPVTKGLCLCTLSNIHLEEEERGTNVVGGGRFLSRRVTV